MGERRTAFASRFRACWSSYDRNWLSPCSLEGKGFDEIKDLLGYSLRFFQIFSFTGIERDSHMNTTQTSKAMEQSRSEIFWGEIAPCEHLVQIYQDEGVFIDALEGFIAGGLKRGESALVIATAPHLSTLEERLREQGISLSIARASDQYISLQAEETLTKFMVRGWPDEELFEQFITELLARARCL